MANLFNTGIIILELTGLFRRPGGDGSLDSGIICCGINNVGRACAFFIGGIMFGIDWDGDGKEGTFDDLLTLHILDEGKKKSSGSGNNSGGGCGTCAFAVLALPAFLILGVLKGKGFI